MNLDSSPLCPNCRRPMVDISKLILRTEGPGEWGDIPEDEADWDVPLGGETEGEQIWECPNCGYREYEP